MTINARVSIYLDPTIADEYAPNEQLSYRKFLAAILERALLDIKNENIAQEDFADACMWFEGRRKGGTIDDVITFQQIMETLSFTQSEKELVYGQLEEVGLNADKFKAERSPRRKERRPLAERSRTESASDSTVQRSRTDLGCSGGNRTKQLAL